MKENYYLSHNIDVYLDWLEEYQDTNLLHIWLNEQIYCCFGEKDLCEFGEGYTLGSGSCDGRVYGDGRSYGFSYADGSGMSCGYTNLRYNWLDGKGNGPLLDN